MTEVEGGCAPCRFCSTVVSRAKNGSPTVCGSCAVTHVAVRDGKYTFMLHEDGWSIRVLRNDEEWLTIEKGHRAISGLMFELRESRESGKIMATSLRNIRHLAKRMSKRDVDISVVYEAAEQLLRYCEESGIRGE